MLFTVTGSFPPNTVRMNEAFELPYIKATCFFPHNKTTGSVCIKHLVVFLPSFLRQRRKTQLKIMWIMENHYSRATESRHRGVHCTVTNRTWIHPPSPLKPQHNPPTTSPALYGPTARWWMRWVQYMAPILSSASLLFARDFLVMEDFKLDSLALKHNSQVESSIRRCILYNALSSAGLWEVGSCAF